MAVFTRRDRIIPMIQMLMFGFLVVMTPFVVVVRYLQGAVHTISHLKFSLFGLELPIIASLIVAGLIAFLIWQRAKIDKTRIIACLIIIGMVAVSQNVQDLYGDMSVYDLQRNWHYIAYSGFVFFFFQAFYVRGMPLAKMIILSFLIAIGMSIFDETFQFFMSNRIFDISDIAKDSWGAVTGLILVLFVAQKWGTIKFREHTFWQKRFVDYGRDPLGAFTIVGVTSWMSISISPLLTDEVYIIPLTLTIIGCSIAGVLLIHLLQFKKVRMVIISIAVLIAIGLTGSFIINKGKNITHVSNRLIVYNGIPYPFYDLMIYPSGLCRFVDKKHFFNGQDQQFFAKQKNADILIIGSGFEGVGGKGYRVNEGTMFIFNEYSKRASQIIILKTPDAVKVYNRLRKVGKNVLFVIHITH